MNYINLERISILSEADKSVALYQKIIKLSEEAGEISDANDITESPTDIKEIVEETCDTINVAVDIINTINRIESEDRKLGVGDWSIVMNIFDDKDVSSWSIDIIINKINSEVGKCSQSFLRVDGAKNVSKTAGMGYGNIVHSVNTVLNLCDTLIKHIIKSDNEITEDFVVKMFNKKLDKWQTKTEKYKD